MSKLRELFEFSTGIGMAADVNTRVLGKALYARGIIHYHYPKNLEKFMELLTELCTEDERGGLRYKFVYLSVLQTEKDFEESGERDYSMKFIASSLDEGIFKEIASLDYMTGELANILKGES